MAWPIASRIQYLGNHLRNVVGRPQWYAKQDDAARRTRPGTVSQLSEVFVKGQQNTPFILSKKHDIFIANTGRTFGDGQNIMPFLRNNSMASKGIFSSARSRIKAILQGYIGIDTFRFHHGAGVAETGLNIFMN